MNQNECKICEIMFQLMSQMKIISSHCESMLQRFAILGGYFWFLDLLIITQHPVVPCN